MWISSSSRVGVGVRITWRTAPQSFGLVSAVDHSYRRDFCTCFWAASVAREGAAATRIRTTASGILFICSTLAHDPRGHSALILDDLRLEWIEQLAAEVPGELHQAPPIHEETGGTVRG